MSGKGWWNSAISGLESRLDTILAEDDQAGAKSRVADGTTKQDGSETPAVDKKLAVERNPSRSRPNSRLQDRLAKVVNKGTEGRASSDFGSRPESPALPSPATAAVADTAVEPKATPSEGVVAPPAETVDHEPPQLSLEATSLAPVGPSPLSPTSPPVTPLVAEQPASTPVPTMSIPTIVAPQTSSRPSLESNVSRPSIESVASPSPLAVAKRDPEVVEAELSLLQKTYEEIVRDNREELNGHLERIDALQSKLTYVAQQLASSSKATVSGEEIGPEDKRLAEKDTQIAALMEEGQKLSKSELKHLTTIKKLRAKSQEQDKDMTILKQRLTKAEKSITEQSERAKRAEAADKAAQEKLKIVGKIEKDIEAIKAEREEAGLTINELRKQLNQALSRAEDTEKRVQAGALETERRATASLKEDIENLQIEKKLAEGRAKRELQTSQDEAKAHQEKAKVVELELRGEIAVRKYA